jgi:hypothetical protein
MADISNSWMPPSCIQDMRREYALFRLKSSELTHLGLFYDKDNIYVVISELGSGEADINEVKKQYDEVRSLGTPPPEFVGEIPNKVRKFDSYSPFEKVFSHGAPFTDTEFLSELMIYLPKEVQPFRYEFQMQRNSFRLYFHRKLTDSECNEVNVILASMGLDCYNIEIGIDESVCFVSDKEKYLPNKPFNLMIRPSVLVGKDYSNKIRRLYEDDEDFWIDNKLDVFTSSNFKKENCFPDGFSTVDTSCFVNASVFPRENIRNYLALYRQVVIAPPLAGMRKGKDFSKQFRVKKYEYEELIRRGRICLVFPQNLHRYDKKVVESVAEINPSAVMFSRRLAASSVVGIRNQTGLFGVSLPSEDQYACLSMLNQVNSVDQTVFKAFIESLATSWVGTEDVVNSRGALGVCNAGLAAFASKLWELRGRDLGIEMYSVASSYEYAQGLGAHYIPFDSKNYSEVAAAQFIGSLYSGVQSCDDDIRETELSELLSCVLTIDNDMNVLELDDALEKEQVEKIPDLLKQYAGLSEEELAQKVYNLNRSIKDIEKKSSRLRQINVSGLLAACVGYGAVATGYSHAALLPIACWVLNALTVYAKNNAKLNCGLFSKLSALNLNSSQDAVLVHGIRNSVR